MTVLLGLMECEGRRTLTGWLREVGQPPSWSGLSRFLSEAPWSQEQVVSRWLTHFRAAMSPLVEAEQEHRRKQQPRRRGRPKPPLGTGDVIGDDATLSQPKGRKMEGLGKHHCTTEEKGIVSQSVVQGLSVLLERRCPLAPHLSRQAKVCAAEGVPFQSQIALMEALIRGFEPVAGSRTHLLLDSWYCAQRLWRAARERDFLITTGLKSHRWLRVPDEATCQGWRWHQLPSFGPKQ